MEIVRRPANSRKLKRLASKLQDKAYRDGYVGARARRFLAHQMRALRGDLSQAEFGRLIDKPQSVVSRWEDPTYGKMTLASLLDVAARLDRALVVQFMDWPSFVAISEDQDPAPPRPYADTDIGVAGDYAEAG